MNEKWPYGKAYIWKGEEIGVAQGLGGKFIVGKGNEWGHKRIKSPSLPVCSTAEEAQQNLDKFAADRGLLWAREGARA